MLYLISVQIKIHMYLNDKMIVAVDDNKTVLGNFDLCLGSLECKYKLFDNATNALYFIQNNHVDMLITDYCMEPMDGLQLIKEIRKHNHDIYIILQSGVMKEDGYKQNFSQLNIQTFVRKPLIDPIIKSAIFKAFQ